jgi:hypothetical protein
MDRCAKERQEGGEKVVNSSSSLRTIISEFWTFKIVRYSKKIDR